MRSSIMSQWRERRMGVIWQDSIGALTKYEQSSGSASDEIMVT